MEKESRFKCNNSTELGHYVHSCSNADESLVLSASNWKINKMLSV